MGSVVRFSVFDLDLHSHELRKRGIRLHLPDQSFEILAMLVERPGDVITREEIRERLWPQGTVVEFEHSVNSAVKRLRDCLGDSAATPRFIETLPRRGYRFLAPLEAREPHPSSPHFRILGEAGRGCMGVVYRAEDLNLGRIVALKFLPEELAHHPPSVERLRREARTLASLNHPGICALHGVEEQEGRLCLVMEYLEGQPLSRLIGNGPLALAQALRIAVDASEALGAAHSHGIVHHDITPANIFVTTDGRVKILDFGLAKVTRREPAKADSPPQSRGAAVPGCDASASSAQDGTTGYISPEQIRGEGADARSDVFSLGVVLYEAVCGRRPSGDGKSTPPRNFRPDIPEDLERVLLRCLAEAPEARYSSGIELHQQLKACQAPAGSGARRRAAVASLCLAVAVTVVWASVHARRVRLAGKEDLPEVSRLLEQNRPLAALQLMRRAERLSPPSPELIRLRERLPPLRISLRTQPPGAYIYILDYAEPDERTASRWELLGRSPLETDRIPAGNYRVRAVKDGFEPVERLLEIRADAGRTIELLLHAAGTAPAGMVWVPGAGSGIPGRNLYPFSAAEVPGFWLDRHEVTNRQFKELADAGGYQKREYWKQPFIKDGRELSWEQAMAEFRDASGRPGPATWEIGSYPEGKGEFPVGGVSWYEAAAFAEFAGKSLPTIHHWMCAAGVREGSYFAVLQFSNFAGRGSAQVESWRGLGPSGTYDMAGNVREWCWNPVGKFRYIAGGGWSDPAYQLNFPNALGPFHRGASNGFRCARYVSLPPEELAREVAFAARDRRSDRPAGDAAYRIYRDLHSYDKLDLKAAVESSDGTSPHWRREKVTFQAAYGSERVVAHLFLPSSALPPYQVVVFFPGSTAMVAPTIEAHGFVGVMGQRLLRAGRAMVLPAYKGTLERGPGTYYHWIGQPNLWREINLQWSKDLGRSLDYLETRQDIDTRRIAFLGRSLGAAVGPRLVAVEPRLKVAVLVSGGSLERVLPEVDSWNFAPRVQIPVLMLNGRDDFLFPVQSSQLPLLRLLGTPEKDKKHLLYDGAHDVYARLELFKDMVEWLDRHLGPVKLRR